MTKKAAIEYARNEGIDIMRAYLALKIMEKTHAAEQVMELEKLLVDKSDNYYMGYRDALKQLIDIMKSFKYGDIK